MTLKFGGMIMIDDALEALFDKDNVDNIVLYDENDNPEEYEQIAIIPLLDKMFAILRNVKVIGTPEEDTAQVFYLGDDKIMEVFDEQVANTIFEKFYALQDGKELEDKYLTDEALDKILAAFKQYK